MTIRTNSKTYNVYLGKRYNVLKDKKLNYLKKNKWLILAWSITLCCLLITIHMGRQYNRVCTHIMNINDGIYESNASVDAKNRAYYLANFCFVSH
jgi:hypothetical protein